MLQFDTIQEKRDTFTWVVILAQHMCHAKELQFGTDKFITASFYALSPTPVVNWNLIF